MNFIENESKQKLRGGYYTPAPLAEYIARWVIHGGGNRFLEPSCGDGAFIDALQHRRVADQSCAVLGFEIDTSEAEKARQRVARSKNFRVQVLAEDFLQWAIHQMGRSEERFDGALGNPPFIRYQYLPEFAQQRAEAVFRLLHLPFTKHTNAWVPFVLASVALLKPGGRLGMIVPAEIIHVIHAQAVRSYLGSSCSRILIIDPEEIWFEQTLQGAVILLAERKLVTTEEGEGLGIAQVKGRDFITQDAEGLFGSVPRLNGETVEGKWTRALLSNSERNLLSDLLSHPEIRPFSAIADVDVGIVTGANDFFLVDDDVVRRFALKRFAHPMFGRSEHCPGVIYDRQQHERNTSVGNPTNFIWIEKNQKDIPPGLREYIKHGESDSLHTRYKCRVRSPWYAVPSVYATRVGMLKRAHDTHKLILNEALAYTTDTAYRIQTRNVEPQKLVYAFLNPLTALTAELEGRHYGGGVLELVPSEIEKLLIPIPKGLRPALRKLDTAVRSRDADAVLLDQADRVLGLLGVSTNSQLAILEAWRRLKNRRQRISPLGKLP